MNRLIIASTLIALAATPAFAGTKATMAKHAVPDDYREQIAAGIHDVLKDPYSVRDAMISKPLTVWNGIFGGGNVPAVCIKLNSKNGFGAYTGIQARAAGFKNGKLAGFSEALDSEKNKYVGNCEDAEWVPFPEINGKE